MGTADMHGGKVEASEEGIKFTDNQGNPVAFETCRLGTIKEFETVKAALENRERAHNLSLGENSALRAEAAKAAEKLATADAAYKAEKETSAGLRSGLAGAEAAFRASESGNVALTTELADANGERGRLTGLVESEKAASAVLAEECGSLQAESVKMAEELKSRAEAIASKDAELEDLMPVKAQLEETNTALEVARKELTEATEALADAAKANEGYRDALAARGKDIGEVTSALETSERQLGESRATTGALVSRMRAFCDGALNALESEKTGIDVLVAFLAKLSGE